MEFLMKEHKPTIQPYNLFHLKKKIKKIFWYNVHNTLSSYVFCTPKVHYNSDVINKKKHFKILDILIFLNF